MRPAKSRPAVWLGLGVRARVRVRVRIRVRVRVRVRARARVRVASDVPAARGLQPQVLDACHISYDIWLQRGCMVTAAGARCDNYIT